MTDPLDLDRFRALADAYGGAVARWPVAYRASAARIAATPEGTTILAQVSGLDAQLDSWAVPAPSTGLAARIAAAGSQPRARSRLGWWWPGIGIAATIAGAAASTAAIAMVAPVEVGGGGTSFGDVAGVDG